MDFAEKRKFQGNYDTLTQTKRMNPSFEQSNSEKDLSSSVHASMDIPSAKVSQVIGKRGTAVQAIMEQSGCRVRVDPDVNQDPRRVYITGSPDGISKAMTLIQRILREGPSFLVPLSDIDTPKLVGDMITDDSDVVVPHAKVATLIGAKGIIVGEIMKRTGCKVHVLQDGVPDGEDRAVSFTGTPDQIAEAKKLVLSVIRDGPTALGTQSQGGNNSGVSGGLLVEERDIIPSQVGIVIGSRGSTLKEIMVKSGGCKIYVNQNFPEGSPHKIVYTGTRDQINLATYLVGLVCERGPQALEHVQTPVKSPSPDLILFQSQINRVMGPHGAIIHGIQSQHMVNITFEPILSTMGYPDPQSRVVVQGHVDGVKNALRTICAYLGISDNSNQSYMYGSHDGYQSHSYNPTGFSLGTDGSAGFLEPPVHLADGMSHQVAELKDSASQSILGKTSNMLPLISKKSGAKVQTPQPGQDSGKPVRPGFTRVHIVGSPSSVTLASQMIQEILINGTGKVHQMPDVPLTVPGNYNVFSQHPAASAPHVSRV